MNVVLNLRIRSTFQVADELVAEFSDPINGVTSPDQVWHQADRSVFHLCYSCNHIGKSWMECANVILLYNLIWQQQYDEKNIRRRVYDALNVLMAMDIISKDKKEIQWKGLPRTSLNDIEELKVWFQSLYFVSWVSNGIYLLFFIDQNWAYTTHYVYFMQTERLGLRSRIEKKAIYLQELEEQVWIAIIYSLMLRNFSTV